MDATANNCGEKLTSKGCGNTTWTSIPKIDHDHAQAVVACASWADKLSSITLTLLEPMIS
jgi:hypothetical protein